MKRTNIIMLLLLFSVMAIAQTQKPELKQGKIITSEIAPGENHRYPIELAKDQLAFLKVMQKGVDLVITTYDPDGKKLDQFDSPNGKNGPELVSLKSDKKGKYSVEIHPFDQNEPKGNYEVNVEKIKQRATTPNGKVDELFAVWDNNYSPGAAVAIVKDGKIIYEKGYGIANLEYDIPITPASVFHIASVSKQFTVFSILLLEQQGKLSLDDDIRKYVPEVPDFGKTITLRHLASHTSGLRDQWELLNYAGWRPDDVITKDQIMKIISQQKELNFNPGEEYMYCNTGFTLLAEVVARVSKQTFAQFTKQNIFDPLQMNSTLFYDDHELNVKNRVYSYYSTGTGYKKSNLNYANVGATSLFTTVEDLSKWATNFATLKVGNQSIVDTMNTEAVLNNGQKFGGALGQFVGKYKGLNEIQHGGADAGYRSYLTRFPDQKVSIIVFSNLAEFNPGKIAHDIADIYLTDVIEKPKTDVVKTPEPAKSATAIIVNKAILDSYVGKYEIFPGGIYVVTEKDGTLSGQLNEQPAFPLTALSDTEFEIAQFGVKVVFVGAGADKATVMKFSQGGQNLEASKMASFDKSAVKLSEYEGKYYSDELSTEYRLVAADGKLIVKNIRIEDVDLNIGQAKDKFAGGFGTVEFIRDAKNAITGFRINGGRVRNLWVRKI